MPLEKFGGQVFEQLCDLLGLPLVFALVVVDRILAAASSSRTVRPLPSMSRGGRVGVSHSGAPRCCQVTSRRSGLHQIVLLECPDIRLDRLQRTRRLVTIEVAVERDLIADLGLGFVDPRVGTCGSTLRLKYSAMLSLSGTLSVSRDSGSGSGLPSLS